MHDSDAPELEADPVTQFAFDRGHEVGRLAQAYVSAGDLIDVPHHERNRWRRETAEALRAGPGVLYEAAVEHDGVIVLADILERGRHRLAAWLDEAAPKPRSVQPAPPGRVQGTIGVTPG